MILCWVYIQLAGSKDSRPQNNSTQTNENEKNKKVRNLWNLWSLLLYAKENMTEIHCFPRTQRINKRDWLYKKFGIYKKARWRQREIGRKRKQNRKI